VPLVACPTECRYEAQGHWLETSQPGHPTARFKENPPSDQVPRRFWRFLPILCDGRPGGAHWSSSNSGPVASGEGGYLVETTSGNLVTTRPFWDFVN